ncbi:MAG: YolD-like protein [Bacilli bacterium]|nr:YolD-like protein [Bacilli bacterium]
MTKKLDDMWTTKFLLPEHKVEIIEQEKELQRISRPTLDEQEVEIINEVIGRSVHSDCTIILTLYDVYQHRTLTGHVARIDHQLKQIKIVLFNPYTDAGEWEWIALQDIVNAEIKESKAWEDFERFEF